jgi:hypothetical protein
VSTALPSLAVDFQSRAAREVLARRKARRSLLAFTAATKADYRVNWHHRVLCEYLDRFAAGRIRRMMVFMPPRHGKSELVSRRLPAYLFGRDPHLNIMACSHTAELANAMSRDVQRILEHPKYARLYPGTRIPHRGSRDAKRTNDLFETLAGGEYRASGVGGSITCMGFDVGVIDDPIKSREEADSPTKRNRVWEWYVNDFYSRRQGDAARILITLTRWHRDDLAGRLLRQMTQRNADQWTVISLPAIKTAENAHADDPRQDGEPLWPEFMSLVELQKTREQDAKAFAALYQQDPAEGGGAEWPPEHFGDWLWVSDDDWPGGFDLSAVAVDPSKGGKDKKHDYSAIIHVGDKNGLMYVDADLARRPPHEIVRAAIVMCDRARPQYVGFEANQFQDLLIPEFRRQASDFAQRWPIYKMVNKVNKEVRIRRLGLT